MNDNNYFMQRAIRLSEKSIENGGGPFGAVVVKNNEIVAEAANQVTQNNDPTAHAEIAAIRLAAKKLNTFDLSGCTIFTSCEPCPMCLGAIYWAHIDKIFFANDRSDAKNIGFDDSLIYEEIKLSLEERKIPIKQILHTEGQIAFENWQKKEDKINY
ncbi:MAG: nucleoside deaminase [Bacteroidetes bacterium]|jgi:tRNA(Arg) A34 adenosine deaminase TadA|nr:nucleoside deaminase [Bacteroidota bacterium]MBT6685387.1 nucleoside deaminase [Bacteroidota bacterium]MBT7145033.1 nucleoside deaminase [Bacteroidota bacterium]MBT7492718.1 nucleoside deaminase [Bacteroidota bacterium]